MYGYGYGVVKVLGCFASVLIIICGVDNEQFSNTIFTTKTQDTNTNIYRKYNNSGKAHCFQNVAFIDTPFTETAIVANIFDRLALEYELPVFLFKTHYYIDTPVGNQRIPLPELNPFNKMRTLQPQILNDQINFNVEYLSRHMANDTQYFSLMEFGNAWKSQNISFLTQFYPGISQGGVYLLLMSSFILIAKQGDNAFGHVCSSV